MDLAFILALLFAVTTLTVLGLLTVLASWAAVGHLLSHLPQWLWQLLLGVVANGLSVLTGWLLFRALMGKLHDAKYFFERATEQVKDSESRLPRGLNDALRLQMQQVKGKLSARYSIWRQHADTHSSLRVMFPPWGLDSWGRRRKWELAQVSGFVDEERNRLAGRALLTALAVADDPVVLWGHLREARLLLGSVCPQLITFVENWHVRFANRAAAAEEVGYRFDCMNCVWGRSAATGRMDAFTSIW